MASHSPYEASAMQLFKEEEEAENSRENVAVLAGGVGLAVVAGGVDIGGVEVFLAKVELGVVVTLVAVEVEATLPLALGGAGVGLLSRLQMTGGAERSALLVERVGVKVGDVEEAALEFW